MWEKADNGESKTGLSLDDIILVKSEHYAMQNRMGQGSRKGI